MFPQLRNIVNHFNCVLWSKMSFLDSGEALCCLLPVTIVNAPSALKSSNHLVLPPSPTASSRETAPSVCVCVCVCVCACLCACLRVAYLGPGAFPIVISWQWVQRECQRMREREQWSLSSVVLLVFWILERVTLQKQSSWKWKLDLACFCGYLFGFKIGLSAAYGKPINFNQTTGTRQHFSRDLYVAWSCHTASARVRQISNFMARKSWVETALFNQKRVSSGQKTWGSWMLFFNFFLFFCKKLITLNLKSEFPWKKTQGNLQNFMLKLYELSSEKQGFFAWLPALTGVSLFQLKELSLMQSDSHSMKWKISCRGNGNVMFCILWTF